MFHIFSQEFYWIILLQIPGMDNQPNPAPKIPQEDLDEEVQLTYCEHHNVMYGGYTHQVLGGGFPYSIL